MCWLFSSGVELTTILAFPSTTLNVFGASFFGGIFGLPFSSVAVGGEGAEVKELERARKKEKARRSQRRALSEVTK